MDDADGSTHDRHRNAQGRETTLRAVAQLGAGIEVIAVGQRILGALGLGERVVLELNTLGDPESRAAYRQALVDYFNKFSA